jgi:hypothetical protein
MYVNFLLIYVKNPPEMVQKGQKNVGELEACDQQKFNRTVILRQYSTFILITLHRKNDSY